MKLIRTLQRLLLLLTVVALAGAAGCGDAGGDGAAGVRPDEGVSVVYQVEFPTGYDPAGLLQQTIDDLQARAESSGKSWYIVSTGWNELEIVAPAPYEDKKAIDATVATIRNVVESGTLSFHIVADPRGEGDKAALPQDEQKRLRDAFREEGVRDVGKWRWVVLKDPDSVAGSTEVSLADLDAEGVAEMFAGRAQMIVERLDDGYYVLLGDSPDSAMTRDQDWAIESVSRGADEMGRPMVAFHLDEAGGVLLKRLTTANTDRRMAVVVSGEILMAPVIHGAIAQDVSITGGANGLSASEIANMVIAFKRKPLPVISGPPVVVTSFSRPQIRKTQ